MSTVMGASLPRPARWWFVGVAALAALIVLVGFSPTFFLRPAAMPPLPGLLVLHGIVFSSWMVLLLVQTWLIAADRRDIHRKLGIFGALLAIAIPVLGLRAAIESMRLGHTPLEGLDPRSFFALPFRAMFDFTILAACAIGLRRNPAAHKRLIILATFSMLDAALARWPGVGPFGPPAFYAIQDLLVAGVCLHDKLVHGRVHKAYRWGAALIVLTQPLFLGLSGTPAWLAFADWFRGLAG